MNSVSGSVADLKRLILKIPSVANQQMSPGVRADIFSLLNHITMLSNRWHMSIEDAAQVRSHCDQVISQVNDARNREVAVAYQAAKIAAEELLACQQRLEAAQAQIDAREMEIVRAEEAASHAAPKIKQLQARVKELEAKSEAKIDTHSSLSDPGSSLDTSSRIFPPSKALSPDHGLPTGLPRLVSHTPSADGQTISIYRRIMMSRAEEEIKLVAEFAIDETRGRGESGRGRRQIP